VLSEDHKDIWRQTRHPALVSFLRTEPSLAEGTLYAYHAYQFETLADAAPAIRDAVNYSPRIYVGHFSKAARASFPRAAKRRRAPARATAPHRPRHRACGTARDLAAQSTTRPRTSDRVSSS
jgi:hypothetical protein